MRAILQTRYGGPEVLQLADLPDPLPARGEVVVRVAFASVNAADWHLMTGTPRLVRPVFGLLRPSGSMVTYCAKGNVRRLLEQVGFNVERLKGPPGKQHMLRATRTMA